jgi:hypothetical protein
MSWLDFIIIGTQKGGTTALNVNLAKHPQISTDNREDPIISEVHYFDRTKFFKNNKPCTIEEANNIDKNEILEFLKFSIPGALQMNACGNIKKDKGKILLNYETILEPFLNELITTYKKISTVFLYKCRLFLTLNRVDQTILKKPVKELLDHIFKLDRLCGKILVGEKTACIMFKREYLERVHTSFPAVKLIVTLRAPIPRAYSHWKMLKIERVEVDWFTPESRSFEKCLEEELIQLQKGRHLPPNYLERGFYNEQLSNIKSICRGQPVFILWAEHALQNISFEYSKIFAFLNVNPDYSLKFQTNINVSSDRSSVNLSHILNKRLKQFFISRHEAYNAPAPDPRAAPIASEPESSDPIASEPESSDPIASEPESSDPIASEPESSEPESSDPIAPDPIALDPIDPDPIALRVAKEVISATTLKVTDAHNKRDTKGRNRTKKGYNKGYRTRKRKRLTQKRYKN